MDAVAFWLAAVAIGVLALPLAAGLFRRFPDGGAGLALPLGMVIAAFAYFVLRVASIVPAGRGGWFVALLMLACVSAVSLRVNPRRGAVLRRSLPGALAALGVFTVLFFSYVWFRSHVAAIAGTEQPMDFLYLNAMLASPSYPPHDPWFAGEAASYYYFGYLHIALLTAVADVPASTGYNLGLAFTFASAGTAVASIAFALARWALPRRSMGFPLSGAVLALVLLLAAGSLSAPLEWAAAQEHYNEPVFRTFGVDWMIPCDAADAATGNDNCYSGAVNPRTTEWYPTEFWFWWRGTRIIPDTITEFPFFSFLLGDLHPHVMALPLVLLAVALAAATWRGRGLASLASHRQPESLLLLAVVFGGLAFMNAWDVISFFALLAAAALLRNVRARPFRLALLHTATWSAPVAALAVVFYLPWYATFSSQADGIFPYIGKGTIPAHAFLQFGTLLSAIAAVAGWALRRHSRGAAWDALALALWFPLVPLLAWIVYAMARGELDDAVAARSNFGWVTLAAYGIVAWLLASLAVTQARTRDPVVIVAGLGAVAVLLLYGTELFYVGDVFRGFIPRQNTVFKLSYQAWAILAVAGPVAIVVACSRLRTRPLASFAAAPGLVLAAAALVYPLLALPNRTDAFDTTTHIDGLAFLAESSPDEYALVRWIDANVPGGAVVIEATGRQYRLGDDRVPVFDPAGPSIDYGESGRVSARTGRQTPIGWPGHEVQWRGSDAIGGEIARRQDLVDHLYLSDVPGDVVDGMRALNASYIVVGRIERERYPVSMDPVFESALQLVFESGNTRVYRVPVYATVNTS
ncbi:MAG: DUF2298 domain-containing protein [Dehalococcoidia bacterium]|nr:hypothetical protein [Dehalococcoidia bacterium]MCB9486721.1 hypothetical protein [Thermoflexaceae bacterium]